MTATIGDKGRVSGRREHRVEDERAARHTQATAKAGSSTVAHTEARGISAVEEVLLLSFTTFRLMTVAQMTRLHYAMASLEWVRKHLNSLAARGYLIRFQAPSRGAGNSTCVYTLSRKGMRLLSDLGVSEQLWQVRPKEQADAAFTFLEHALGVTDLLITSKLLELVDPTIVVAELVHDWRLKQSPVAVTTYKGEKLKVVADGLVRLELHGKAQMTVVFENDRGTMEGASMLCKLRALLAAYGHDGYTIAFVTTAGQQRALSLRRWCEQVLKEAHQEAMADLFLFTALPQPPHLSLLTPQELFLAPMWAVPFATQPVALIER